MSRQGKRGVLGVFGVVLAGLALAGAASASTWTAAKLAAGDVGASLYGVSCPTNGLCVAVGGNGTIAATANPLGGASSWTVSRPDGGFHPEFPGVPGSTYGGAQLRDVDCPAPTLCFAASFDGNIYTSTDPLGGGAAWKTTELTPPKTPRIHLLGISCPTATFCVGAGYGGKIVYSTNPTGEAAGWHVTALGSPYDFRGISCASPTLCVAVDLAGDVVYSTDPTGGAAAWVSAGAPAGDERLTAIDCPGPHLCLSGNSRSIVYSTDPAGGPATWRSVEAGTGIPITGVSCPSESACAAVDQNSDVLVSTDPTAGRSAWSFKTVISFAEGREGEVNGNGMFGISCASASLCVGTGSQYQVIASGDPFAADSPAPGRDGRGKRPRVEITRHPAKRLDLRRGGVRVTFRFRAIGKASGFRCKLGASRRYRRCQSPISYRVRSGAQVFKVRAIGPGGLKGHPSAFHFRVGNLTEPAPAGSCQNPSSRGGCVNA